VSTAASRGRPPQASAPVPPTAPERGRARWLLGYSQRPQVNPDRQIDLLLDVAQAAVRAENLPAEAGASQPQSDPGSWQRRSHGRIGP